MEEGQRARHDNIINDRSSLIFTDCVTSGSRFGRYLVLVVPPDNSRSNRAATIMVTEDRIYTALQVLSLSTYDPIT